MGIAQTERQFYESCYRTLMLGHVSEQARGLATDMTDMWRQTFAPTRVGLEITLGDRVYIEAKTVDATVDAAVKLVFPETIPDDTLRVYVNFILVQYTTVGPPAGARQLRIAQMFDSTGPATPVVTAFQGTQPNNTTRYYVIYPGARAETFGDVVWCPWPDSPPPIITDSKFIEVRCLNLTVPGDSMEIYAVGDSEQG